MMTETACFLMTGKAVFVCRVFPTHFYANISEMRYFRQIRLWKRRYSKRTPIGAFPAAHPLSGVGTEKSIARNAPRSHIKSSRRSTQEKSVQNRKIGGKKPLMRLFNPHTLRGKVFIPFPLFFYLKTSTNAWKGGFLCLILRQGIP